MTPCIMSLYLPVCSTPGSNCQIRNNMTNAQKHMCQRFFLAVLVTFSFFLSATLVCIITVMVRQVCTWPGLNVRRRTS